MRQIEPMRTGAELKDKPKHANSGPLLAVQAVLALLSDLHDKGKGFGPWESPWTSWAPEEEGPECRGPGAAQAPHCLRMQLPQLISTAATLPTALGPLF